MTIVNGYCTLDDIKQDLREINPGDPQFDTALEAAIAAASRQIDGYCGRTFWQDSGLVDRVFYSTELGRVEVDDISTITGLVVKSDTSIDGTYPTTLTINTNFIVRPPNAQAAVPLRPYTELFIVDYSSYFPVLTYGRPGVKVTAKWGWPAIPDAVAKACRIQAMDLFQAPSKPHPAMGLPGIAASRVGPMNPYASGLLDDFVKLR